MTALNDAERVAPMNDLRRYYPAWMPSYRFVAAVIAAYVLTFGGLMLLGGRLGDTIGRKRTFIVGVSLFTIASVLCGVAWDEATLVIARLLQGVGAAIA